MRTVPAHYIRPNDAHRVPRRLIVINTESVTDRSPVGETHVWRCGSASFIHWTNKGHMHRVDKSYDSDTELWRDVAEHTRPKQRTVLYAHNLPYVLRISRALHNLPELRFSLDAIRVSQSGSWSRWTRNGASLTLCDSASLFPVTVYTLGMYLERRRLPIPDSEDAGPWLARCERDRGIVADTLVQYLDWLRTGVAGNWQLTGAGQSWSHWRHAHYTHQILVHIDDDAIAAERRAMYTGRAETFAWGRELDAPVYEWDWANAYPRIARDSNIPTRLVSRVNRVSATDLSTLMRKHIVLADLEVTTDTPIVPARHNGRILWPVGTFETTLWDPEIKLLIEAGAHITVKRAWLYRPEPALQSWARWVLAEIHPDGPPQYRWMGPLLKHWSRALIGRFAAQYQNWEMFGQDTESKVLIGRMVNTDTGEDTEFMQVGHDIHVMNGMSESDDSCPQITSYICSIARANLWNAMCAVGLSHVLYVDTDSLVVDTHGNTLLRTLTNSGSFPGLRLKSRALGYEIYGPRAAIIGDETKMAGIPRNSQRTGETTWRGEVWTTIDRALKIGETDRVSITPRPFTVRWNEHRRARVSDGRTVAYRLPEYVPERPTGAIPAVLESEQVRANRGALRRAGLTSRAINGGADQAIPIGRDGPADVEVADVVRVAAGIARVAP